VLLAGLLWLPERAGAQCPDNVPHVTGTWRTLPYQVPINPISATVLHTGEVLLVAGSENDAHNHQTGAQSYRALTWDPTGADASAMTVVNVGHDVFCSGTVQMPDGRAFIVGGTNSYSFTGSQRALIYDPGARRFVPSQSMADGRWYPTATTLGDGRIMAFSGLALDGSTNRTTQIFDLANSGPGWGTTLLEPFTPPLFPRIFLLPNGKLFYTGQGSGSRNTTGWIHDPVARTWTASATTTRERSYGNSVLLPLLPPSYTPKVMNLGGNSPATRTTEIINLSAATPSWIPGPDMSTARIHMNTVLLPDGSVLAEGGSVNSEAPDGPGKTADLYHPSTNSFTSGGTADYSRLYHSTAVLLPDATVASLGSNPGDRGKYLGAIEIYTPPYLYDVNDHLVTADRAVITAFDPVVRYGEMFDVGYAGTYPIDAVVLVRPSSTTHAFDMDQRLVGLCGPAPQPPCLGPGGTLTLTAPPNGNIAPPGYYMLFLIDSAGVPSRAEFIKLTPFASPPPDGTISSPASDVTINAGGSVFFQTTSTAAEYSWVFPGGTPTTSTSQTPGNVTFGAAGRYTVSLTLVDGSGNSDPSPPVRIVNVRPQTGDFDIAVYPAFRTVAPGQSQTFTVHVTPLTNFTGTVSLTASSENGFPSGVSSGGFSPATIGGGSGTSTLTMNTTTSAKPYAVSVTVKGVSGSLSHTASTTLLVNLYPPGGVQASAEDSEVSLSWQSSGGASSYRVGRSLVSGGPYDVIACPNGTAYTDTGLENGTTYYYTITAVYTGGANAGGASAPSLEVAATPPCPAVASYSGSIEGSMTGAREAVWSWPAGSGVEACDLVQGDLMVLRATAGDFTAALDAIPMVEEVCLADDTTALSFQDPYGAPASEGGVFVLLRPVATSCPAHGSYDSGGPGQVAGRDPGIAAAARECP
jgi:hypothetical protein